MLENVTAFSSSNKLFEAIFIALSCTYLSIALAYLALLFTDKSIFYALLYVSPAVFLISLLFSFVKNIFVNRKLHIIASMAIVLCILAYMSNFIVVPLHGAL
jgi:hypothetical protein